MSEKTPPAAEQPVDPWLVERLLADPAPGGNADEPGLASLVAALRAPATAAELAQSEHYLEAFTSAQTLRNTSPHSRRTSMLAPLLAAKSVVAGVMLVALAGTAAAAYSGSLPSGLQDVAHHNVGAPAAHASHTPKPHPTKAKPTPTPTEATPTSTPKAFGHHRHHRGAVYGLCTAYTKGGLKNSHSAQKKLAKLAGGQDKIAGFCATILKKHPKKPPHIFPTGTAFPHPSGKPTGHPTGKPGPHPTGKPTTSPTASPTTS
jgi:hypothetical protein